MLKYKINKNKVKEKLREINLNETSIVKKQSPVGVVVDLLNEGTLIKNDRIAFTREGKDKTIYQNEYFVTPLETIGYVFNKIDKYELFVSGIDVVEVTCPGQTFNKILLINFENKHTFTTIRDGGIREDLNIEFLKFMSDEVKDIWDGEYANALNEQDEDVIIRDGIIYNNETITPLNELTKHCHGDYVICNNVFLLHSLPVESEELYEFNVHSLKNTRCKLYIDNGDEVLTLNGIVPYTINGDSAYSMIFFYDDNSENILNNIKDNYINYRFSIEDTSFFESGDYIKSGESYIECTEINVALEGNEDGEYTILSFIPKGCYNRINAENFNLVIKPNEDILIPHKGTKIYKICDTVSIPLNITEPFETNMNQLEIIQEQFTEKRIKEELNPIVDMEKQIFVPVVNSGITQINTSLYDNISTIKFILNFCNRIEWSTDASPNISGYTDNLKNIGFDDDDFLYQRNVVKKSFMRISFYDSKYRSNQSLLYYATIFLDAGELYNKQINNIEKKVVFEINNAFNRKKSSEGYYLYLYPTLCKEKDKWYTIYMKVEFNHAKFGYTIPMAANKVENGYISANDYVSGMTDLLNDLYISIGIRYNSEMNRYEWEIGRNTQINSNNYNSSIIKNGNIIELNLYEPIINRKEDNTNGDS